MNENKAYTSVELPTNVPGIGYTIKHRYCVELLIDYYCKKAIGKTDGNGIVFTKEDYIIMHNRAKCHDMDKVLTSLSYPQLTADYFHRMFNGHHAESMIEIKEKTKYDWIEMLIDMESEHYTKADKNSSNAFSFISTYRQHLLPYMMPYIYLFDIETPTTISTIKEKVQKKYYESDLIDAIIEYIHTTHIHLIDSISRIDDIGYMALYKQPTPYRHPSTQKPNGTLHVRPNTEAQMSKSVMSRELVKGTFEAQLFDMDKLCLLPVSNINNINKQGLQICKQLVDNKLQR